MIFRPSKASYCWREHQNEDQDNDYFDLVISLDIEKQHDGNHQQDNRNEYYDCPDQIVQSLLRKQSDEWIVSPLPLCLSRKVSLQRVSYVGPHLAVYVRK